MLAWARKLLAAPFALARWVRRKIQEHQERLRAEEEARRAARRDEIVALMLRPLTDDEIAIYTDRLRYCMPRFVGDYGVRGRFSESDIKWRILRENAHLFTEDELNDCLIRMGR